MATMINKLKDAWLFAKYSSSGPHTYEQWSVEDSDQFSRFMRSQTGLKLRELMLDEEYVAMTAACRKHKGDAFAAGWAAGLQATNLMIHRLSAILPPQTEKFGVEVSEGDGFDPAKYAP